VDRHAGEGGPDDDQACATQRDVAVPEPAGPWRKLYVDTIRVWDRKTVPVRSKKKKCAGKVT